MDRETLIIKDDIETSIKTDSCDKNSINKME